MTRVTWVTRVNDQELGGGGVGGGIVSFFVPGGGE